MSRFLMFAAFVAALWIVGCGEWQKTSPEAAKRVNKAEPVVPEKTPK